MGNNKSDKEIKDNTIKQKDNSLKGKENTGEDKEIPIDIPTRERLTLVEVQRRVDKCIDLRYKSDTPILQREWIDYCEKNYNDKSIPQYINYWMTAKEQYEEQWRGKLENLIEPAVQVLREGLNSDNHYVRSKTIDQIWKMSGNDIQKHLVRQENINIGFGEEED